MEARNDLLIIGAGTLGARVGRLWLDRHPGARVLAETGSTASHDQLRDQGMTPRVRSEPPPAPDPFVLFCVPPSATEDYAAEVLRAIQLWNGEGRLVFTSSTAVYVQSDGEVCTEQGELADTSRARRMLNAERPILEAGGTIVRLTGLYDQDRGPHRVYLRREEAPGRPDGLVNLIHYDDAAALCVAALLRADSGEIFIGCDDRPVTRQEIVDAAHASPRYRDEEKQHRTRFTGADAPRGRRCDSTWTRERLDWRPRYRSFMEWATTS